MTDDNGDQPKCCECSRAKNTNTRITRVYLGCDTAVFIVSNRTILPVHIHAALREFIEKVCPTIVEQMLWSRAGVEDDDKHFDS